MGQIVGACGLVLLLGAVPLSAAVGPPEVADAEVESHCVVYVTGELPSGEFLVTEPTCFATFAEAMSEITGGVIGAPSGMVLLESPLMQEALAPFTLGIHFDGASGSGNSISVVGDSCTGGWWNTGSTWANRISSSYNGCYRLRHHDLPNKGGAFGDTVGVGSVHNVPASINNRAESVSYWGS